MDQNDLASLVTWFDGYCASFVMPSAEDQRNITVKRDHTHEVRRNAAIIARDQGFAEAEVLLAEAVALFHDVGRFSQYREYRTFDDDRSINHAVRGARVLRETGALTGIPKDEQDLIVRTVALHNVFSVPPSLDPAALTHLKTVRDADKIDIMRVVIGHFEADASERAEAVSLGLPDLPRCSRAVLACLAGGRMAAKADLSTQNDFKLMLLTWLYDLNYDVSVRIVAERGYVGRLVALLPRTSEVRDAVGRLVAYVENRAENAEKPVQDA